MTVQQPRQQPVEAEGQASSRYATPFLAPVVSTAGAPISPGDLIDRLVPFERSRRETTSTSLTVVVTARFNGPIWGGAF
jgi:hypothetical protein